MNPHYFERPFLRITKNMGKKKIHFYKFNLLNKRFVLDVQTSNCFEVDEITYAVLDYFGKGEDRKIVDSLKEKIPAQSISNVLGELKYLQRRGLLARWSEERPKQRELLTQKHINFIHLFVDTNCNLRCKYCYLFKEIGQKKKKHKKEQKAMTFGVAKKSIDFLMNESKDAKECLIYFFGGEPLLNFDIIKKTVNYAIGEARKRSKRLFFKIATNGILLTSQIIDFLSRHDFIVILSIDGPKEVHDSLRFIGKEKSCFDLLTPKIKQLLGKINPYNVIARATLTRYHTDITKIFNGLAELGFKKIEVELATGPNTDDYTIKIGDLEKIKKQYLKFARFYIEKIRNGAHISFTPFVKIMRIIGQPKRNYYACSGGKSHLAISPQGELFPCHKFLNIDGFQMGNVFTGLKLGARKIYFENHVESIKKCSNCWARYYCGGGCFYQALVNNGNIKEPDPLRCEFFKEVVRLAILVYSEIGKEKRARLLSDIGGSEKTNSDEIKIDYSIEKNW